ncbi:hypothetical protein [Chloroherpeton thalassium]|nr:hypothetical protein [Chloroherpeton thalassium]
MKKSHFLFNDALEPAKKRKISIVVKPGTAAPKKKAECKKTVLKHL